MPRQSISFTTPNDEWLRANVESEEYVSTSDVVNDLIRKAQENEAIRARLMQAENRQLVSQDRAEILAEAKAEARRNGNL
jgi:antitoxin ParD1/3/4